MKQSAPGNIIMICDGCKEPMPISPLQESAMNFVQGLTCPCCYYIHTDLDELKMYVKKSRTYGHL